MRLLRKHRLVILSAFAIGAVFFFTRFYNILSLPIFTDEALYVRWAQIAKNDANWRFISLTDGKQTLFIWVAMVAMRFVDDPLLSGRIVSVFAGFLSMVGLFFLGREVFKNHWVGLISVGLYSLYPFALVYDRMALYDSLVGAFAVWSLYFTVLLARRLRLDVAILLGMTIGGGVLNKTNGFFSLYLLPFSLLLFDWHKKHMLMRVITWVGLALIVLSLTYGYYSILRLSPFFHIIDEKNALFVYPFKEWIKHPFYYFVDNWSGLFNWFITYVSWPVFLLIIGSFFVYRQFTREKILLVIWFLFPFVALALFGKTLYPRFIFFMTLSLLPLVALSLYRLRQAIKNSLVFAGCCLLFSSIFLWTDYRILTNFGKAPIPDSDKNQYINDWPSGGGIREAVAFFKKEAEKGKIYIATQGTFGLLPHALEMYLVDNPNIKLVGFWPIENTPPKEVLEASKTMPAYFVFYQPCSSCKNIGEAPASWPVRTIFQVQKGETARYFTVYRVESE